MMYLKMIILCSLLEYLTISCIFEMWDIWNIPVGFLKALGALNVFFGIYYYVVYVFVKKQIRKYNDKLNKDETEKIHNEQRKHRNNG